MTETTPAEQTTAFLKTVVTCEQQGYFCLAVSNGAGGWLEEWFRWPQDLDNGRIVTKALSQAPHANVYFSSYLFKAPQSTKENVLPTRTIQADLDEADLKDLPIEPTVLIETSPGRHQAYWVLTKPVFDRRGNVTALGAPLPLEEHESLSRKMTYSIKLCDRSGWPLGKKVRVPNTLNHKYLSGPKPVVIKALKRLEHAPDLIEALPDVPRFLVEHYDDGFIEQPTEVDVHPLELLKRIESDVPVSVWTKYDVVQNDRSEALWALMMWAFKAGLNRQEVFTLAKGSANNKFRDLKSRADQDLAKDVLRAEHAAKSNTTDPRQVIKDLFRKPLNRVERCRSMFDVVLQIMREQGEFVRSREDMGWYIRRDMGRPIPVTPRSEQLVILLDTQFGLNMTEGEAKFVIQGLYTYAMSLPQTALESSLSYYDPAAQHILIHTGRDTVIRVTPTSIEKAKDGAHGVIFPWSTSVEQFTPSITASAQAALGQYDWGDELFGDGSRGYGSSVNNLMNMTPAQAKALLKVWLMFILFRNVANTKPIIATLGQPGCIAGETVIRYRRGEHSARSLRLQDMYYNSVTRWDSSIPTRVLSAKDGIIKWRTVKSITRSGRKLTHLVTVGKRKPFRSTADHRFLTPAGYRPLSELSVGDEVVVQGSQLTGQGRRKHTRRVVAANHHPYARQRIINGCGPYGTILYCRAVLEAQENGLTVEQYLNIVHTDAVAASGLCYLPKDAHIHHVDENPENDSPSNLTWMTKDEHDRLHGHNNVRNFGHFSGMWHTAVETVTSIEPYGEEETYDIEMADAEAPNFIIDGVVVHNSGKTTLMRKVYRLIYGRYKSLADLTNRDEFDLLTARDPLVVIDNIDTWERWLPDRLATSASVADIERRKLYTDGGVYLVRRQAFVGVTAHNPKFGREDVADRFLLFSFKRFEKFESEVSILEDITSQRNRLWTAIIRDAQRILNTPVPDDPREIPQFRMEDFARFGLWIARGLGVEEQFKSAIEDVKTSQSAFTLEEESMLVSAITQLAARSNRKDDEPMTSAQLWQQLAAYVSDARQFTTVYRNPVQLSKKLSAMQPALSRVVDIRRHLKSGAILWTVKPRAVNT